MAQIDDLLYKLTTKGGRIISTAELSQMEIDTSRKYDDLYVDNYSCGFVWLGKDVTTKKEGLHLQNVSGSAFAIMFQKKPLKNILFQNIEEARNYIKMQNPKRKFKEPKENVFVCSRYGTTFEIIELHYR